MNAHLNGHLRVVVLPMLILAGLALAAYGLPALQPTAPATATLPRPLPITATGRQFYWNDEGGFGLLLPPRWSVGAAQATPFGTLYPLGPAVLAGSAQGSSLIVADAQRYTAAGLLAALCGCPDAPAVSTVTLANGMKAEHAAFAGTSLPRLESLAPTDWYVVAHGDKLIAFSIYSPATLRSLDAVIAGLRFAPAFDAGADGLKPAEAARQALAKELLADPYEIVVVGAQAQGDGYRIMLSARGLPYAYVTDADGGHLEAVR